MFVGMCVFGCYILLIDIYLDVQIMAMRDGSAARPPPRLRMQIRR